MGPLTRLEAGERGKSEKEACAPYLQLHRPSRRPIRHGHPQRPPHRAPRHSLPNKNKVRGTKYTL